MKKNRDLGFNGSFFLVALALVGCGASGHGDVVEGEDAVEKNQKVANVPTDKGSKEGSEQQSVECNEDTNDIGWCDDDHTLVFCVGAEKTWYKVDCHSLPGEGSEDWVCGVRKGQSHVVCDDESKFED